MKGFALDGTGDVLIENNEITMAVGESLVQQNMRSILQTNLGEWFFDWDQGIDFDNMLGKGTNAELVRYEIERGLAQVDSSFVVTEFSYEEDGRKSRVHFKASNQAGEEVGGDFEWA